MNDMSSRAHASSTLTAGGAVFGKLKALGVDHVFANSGTDFPPIIEGLVEAASQGMALPLAVVVPHEHAALGMAHGHYLLSGRPQAVMLHTNVGLSNGATGAINAACDQIPMIIMSGRTPVTEQGRFGARTVPIGWGQEMRDQTALVREACKWDYELRFPEQTAELLDRAHAIANSTPKGPVYLSLPRETLCEPCPQQGLQSPPRQRPVRPAPEPGALAAAARLLAGAKRPLLISQRGVGDAAAFQAFADFVQRHALPVCQYWANQLSLPLGHDMQIGLDPHDALAQADLVLVINSLAPWSPDRVRLADDCQVIQLGPDPLFARFPVRHFRADISLVGETGPALAALMAAVDTLTPAEPSAQNERREQIALQSQAQRDKTIRLAEAGNQGPMSKDWVSLCLGQAIRAEAAQGRSATVFSELGCPLAPLDLEAHNSWFQEPHSGGLGWCLPAALGAQLACPERLVFATMGDGSYMFANPTACHQVGEALQLPVITLILNNEEWGAVRQSVAGLYPQGHAAQAAQMPLTALSPSPDFTLTAQASRAYTETVKDGAELPAALTRAIAVAREQRRQVVLNIAIAR